MGPPKKARPKARKKYDEGASREALPGSSPAERSLWLKGWRYNVNQDKICCVGCGKALSDCGHKSDVF